MKTRFTLLISSLLLATTFSTHATVELNSQCNITLDGNLHIQDEKITINTKEHDTIVIDKQNNISVNDKPLSLNTSQQKHVTDYANAINSAVPLTVEIAGDGVAIANDAITQVLGGLFGEDDDIVTETQELVSDLHNHINSHFHDESGAFVITGSDISSDGWANSQWEENFENKVEDILSQALGKLTLKLGTLFISGDKEASETLSKLENFETNMEAAIEKKADLLEEKSVALCELLKQADIAENHLQSTSVDLANLNILYVKH